MQGRSTRKRSAAGMMKTLIDEEENNEVASNPDDGIVGFPGVSSPGSGLASRLITTLVLWLWFVSQALSVVIAPEHLSEVLDHSESILIVHVVRAELLQDEGAFCGIRYEADVESVIKGAQKERLSFVVSEALWIGGRYLIFLDKKEIERNRKRFTKRANCRQDGNEWYFWAGLNRRYFEVIKSNTIGFSDAVIFISKYIFLKETVFIEEQNVPEHLRDQLSSGWFMYVRDLKSLSTEKWAN
jgi:hypothetical protein